MENMAFLTFSAEWPSPNPEHINFPLPNPLQNLISVSITPRLIKFSYYIPSKRALAVLRLCAGNFALFCRAAGAVTGAQSRDRMLRYKKQKIYKRNGGYKKRALSVQAPQRLRVAALRVQNGYTYIEAFSITCDKYQIRLVFGFSKRHLPYKRFFHHTNDLKKPFVSKTSFNL